MSYKPPSDFHISEMGHMGEDQKNMELLLIQVPKKFDIGQLNGVEYTPGQITDIMRDDSLPGSLSAVYQLASNNTQELDLKPLVKSSSELVVGQSIQGHLSVTKSFTVESKPSQYTLPSLRRPGPPLVPMPAGLRVRFTPFGSGTPTCCRPSASSPEKKKKRKKKKDKDRDSDAEQSSAHHQDSTNAQSPESTELANRLGRQTEMSEEEYGEQTPQEKRKEKKKKHKDKKRDSEPIFSTPKLNGTVDFNHSFACSEVKGILSNSAKAKKHGKNVSFNLDESVFMNSSGDSSRLKSESGETEAKSGNSRDSSDVNGNSLHSAQHNAVQTGKKRKHSSGYSSADTSLEISSPSDAHVKRKKKKHKVSSDDS